MTVQLLKGSFSQDLWCSWSGEALGSCLEVHALEAVRILLDWAEGTGSWAQ